MPYDRNAHITTHDGNEDEIRASGVIGFAGEPRGGNRRVCERDYYFANDELIVHGADLALVRELGIAARGFEEVAPPESRCRPAPTLEDLPDRPAIATPASARPIDVPFAVFRRADSSDPADLLTVLDRLRTDSCDAIGREVRVGVNHILAGQRRFGSPAGPASPSGAIRAPEGDDGEGVTVAILDTAMATDHEWLDGHVYALPDSRESSSPGPKDWTVYTGHATFIAGIVRRVAPGAQIVGAQVLDERGIARDSDVARALLDVVAMGAKVVNLSLGGYTQPGYGPVALGSVIERVSLDVAIVAAAGNKPDGQRMYPAAMKRVYAVGALGASGGRAAFSNFGTWVDACAPGEDIVSCFYSGTGVQIPHDPQGKKTFDGFARWHGTSFATPQLAAAIAVEISRSGVRPHEAVARVLADGHHVIDLGKTFGRSLMPT